MKPVKNLREIVLAGTIFLSTLAPSISDAQSSYKEYYSYDSVNIEQVRKQTYPLKHGKPTIDGAVQYVINNGKVVIDDFQKFFNVELQYDLYFVAEVDNSKQNSEKNRGLKKKQKSEADDAEYQDTEDDNDTVVTVIGIPMAGTYDEKGIYTIADHSAGIKCDDKYLGYSVLTTKKFNVWNIVESNMFIRGIMIHETAHCYFYQVLADLASKKIRISREYSPNNNQSSLGAKLIEEGIAEYCATAMGEAISESGKTHSPQSTDDLLSKDRSMVYKIYYKYGTEYVKDILFKKGLDEGIAWLVTNPPPTNEEILKPELYYARLKPPAPAK